MKKITKIFLALALCMAISFGLAINSSAAESDKPCTEVMGVVEASTDGGDNMANVAIEHGGLGTVMDVEVIEHGGIGTVMNVEAIEHIDTGKAMENEVGEAESITDGEKVSTEEPGDNETKNDFEEIYNAAMSHISEILSLAAFIGSLVCAIIYKSGLMPLMENGLKSLKNATVKIKEATDKAECDNKESISTIEKKLDVIDETVADMCDAFLVMVDSMKGYEDQRAHQKRLDTVLEGELDMLYDIFMTSALPEYEKARVGERMTKLKEVLNSGEGK